MNIHEDLVDDSGRTGPVSSVETLDRTSLMVDVLLYLEFEYHSAAI